MNWPHEVWIVFASLRHKAKDVEHFDAAKKDHEHDYVKTAHAAFALSGESSVALKDHEHPYVREKVALVEDARTLSGLSRRHFCLAKHKHTYVERPRQTLKVLRTARKGARIVLVNERPAYFVYAAGKALLHVAGFEEERDGCFLILSFPLEEDLFVNTALEAVTVVGFAKVLSLPEA